MISPINIISRISVQNKYALKSSKTFSIINDIADIAKQLPRMPTPESYANVKSSASQNSKSVTYRPYAIRRALRWLQEKNPLVKDIHVDEKLLIGDSEIEIESDIVDDDDIEALDEGLNCTISTNTGTDNEINEVFLSAGDPTNSEYDKLRDALGVPLMIRKKGDYAHPMTTSNFWPLAYPVIYPYGMGYVNEYGDSVKYIRHTLEIGGDRAFQKNPSYIFARHHYEMQRKIGGVSSLASAKTWDVNEVVQTDTIVTANDMLGIINAHREDNATNMMNNSQRIDTPARVKDVISRLTPFSQSIAGTVPYILLMKHAVLSMINSPVILERGDFAFFATVAEADLYNAILYAIAVDVSRATTTLLNSVYKLNNAKAADLTIEMRKKILYECPALVCRVFHLKQLAVKKYILDGEDKPIGNVIICMYSMFL
jgi:hypothetical protein